MAEREKYCDAFRRIESAPAAPWVREMNDHYHRTGTYRPEDLRRVMGDQTRGVSFGSDKSLAKNLLG